MWLWRWAVRHSRRYWALQMKTDIRWEEEALCVLLDVWFQSHEPLQLKIEQIPCCVSFTDEGGNFVWFDWGTLGKRRRCLSKPLQCVPLHVNTNGRVKCYERHVWDRNETFWATQRAPVLSETDSEEKHESGLLAHVQPFEAFQSRAVRVRREAGH